MFPCLNDKHFAAKTSPKEHHTLCGALVGLAIRFHGKGYTPLFALLAVIAHLLIVLGAFSIGIFLAPGERIWGVLLFGMYALGAWAAGYLARYRVPFLERRAYYHFTTFDVHPSSNQLKNRWFVAIPIVLVIGAATSLVSSGVILGLNEVFTQQQSALRKQKKSDSFESKAIDVNPSNLEAMSTKQTLLHAYAYYTGYFPYQNGRYVEAYPKSTYKSTTILKYLVKHRNDTRAKFILGVLTEEDGGYALIRQAADEGDGYAQLHVARDFGCYSNQDMGKSMLNRLHRTTNEKAIRQEIDVILKMGFEDVCQYSDQNKFSLSYIASVY